MLEKLKLDIEMVLVSMEIKGLFVASLVILSMRFVPFIDKVELDMYRRGPNMSVPFKLIMFNFELLTTEILKKDYVIPEATEMLVMVKFVRNMVDDTDEIMLPEADRS